MKNYLIIDNYFLNPKELKKWALKQKFYTKKNHPWKETLGKFPGFRTDYINNINEEKFKYLINNLLKACEIFYEEKFQEFETWLSFSYTLNDIKLPDWHTDQIPLSPELNQYKKKLSGIVYLNEDVKKEAGTIVVNNNKPFLIENKFNRLVLYPSEKIHSVAKSFGKNKKNSRFVFTILIYLK
jgi:hypothetical protein